MTEPSRTLVLAISGGLSNNTGQLSQGYVSGSGVHSRNGNDEANDPKEQRDCYMPEPFTHFI